MKRAFLPLASAALTLCSLSAPARAQTVADLAARGWCSTSGLGGISDQLAETQMCMRPGAFVKFTPHSNVTLNNSTIYPFLQASARDALWSASNHLHIYINSAFRTLADQYVLYYSGGCGLAARPGQSNHQTGRALDVQNWSAARSALQNAGCVWLGSKDPVHFDCPGSDGRADAIRAFQRLWNVNHPSDTISEDGSYGPATESRLARSPAAGFPKSGCDAAPVCTPHTEVCNGKDDDCDGQVDENKTTEVCNGKDDDCDGKIDEDLVRDCGSDVGECELGQETCSGGHWGSCVGAVGPQTEACDELDNDCDGDVDDDQVCELEEAWQAALFDSGTHSDINGDGGADICALSTSGIECSISHGNSFVPTPTVNVFDADLASPGIFSTLRVGDVTGDGRADVCLRLPDGVRCWQGTDGGLGDSLLGPELSDAKGWDQTQYFSAVRLGDINGDGKADLCARSKDGLACYPSLGTSFGDARVLSALSDSAGFDDVNRYGTVRLGDVDGDGMTDVCAREPQGMSCWLASDAGFMERIPGPAWTDDAGWSDWHSWSTIRLADVNGDGKSDLCAREDEALRCYLFDGAAFTERLDGPALPAPTWDTRTALASIRMADLDGDGKSDVCVRSEQGLDCWLATDTGFDRQVLGPALPDSDGWSRPESYRTLRLGDINGDNRADICGRTHNGIQCWPYEGGGFGWAVSGPQWSDAAGWDLPERYHSIRLSGVLGGGEVGSGGASSGNGGAANAGGEGNANAATDLDGNGSCACRQSANLGAGGSFTWLSLAGLLLGGLLRRRRANAYELGSS